MDMIGNSAAEFNEYIALNRRCIEFRKWFEDLKEKYDKLQDDYNELQNSFEESQDDLAATTELFLSYKKDAEEFQEELASTQEELAHANKTILKYEEAHNHLFDQLKRQISTVSELKEELRQMRIRIDEVEEDRDNWKTEAIHRQNELNDIEMRNLMSEKPVQECCEYCKRTNCSDCVICPF